MNEKKLFNVVLAGGIKEGFDKSVVKNNLATLFKLPIEKAGGLLNGQSLVVKGSVDTGTAAKYKVAIERAGAVCGLEAIPQEDPLEFDFTNEPSPPPTKIMSPAKLPASPPPHREFAPQGASSATTPAKRHDSIDSSAQSTQSSTESQIEITAKYLKFLIIAIFVVILSGLFLPKDVTKLLGIVCFPVMAFCSFCLAKSLNKNGFLWAVLVLIPIVNLGALLVLIQNSIKTLKYAGYKIGLLGGTKP